MATEYMEKDSPRQASAMQNASPFETDETTFSAPLAKGKKTRICPDTNMGKSAARAAPTTCLA
jgi:hypothetical protein